MGRPASIWHREGRGWYTTIRGKQVFLGLDREQAQREFHVLRSATDPVVISRLTVQVLVDRYLNSVKDSLKPMTMKNYTAALQLWINHCGRLRIAELKPYHLAEWIGMISKKRGSSTVHFMGGIVKVWNTWCASQGYVENNRLSTIRLPPMKRREPAKPEDMIKLVNSVTEPRFRDYLIVLMDTGCRPGEIRCLEAKDVNFALSIATVKGKTGPRQIGLSSQSLDILRRVCEWHPVGPVFRQKNGATWKQGSIRLQFLKASREAGIPPVVPYHCRHDFWARAARAGIDSVVAGKQLGHTNLTMLHRHYAHAQPEMLVNAVEAAAVPSIKPDQAQKQTGLGNT